MSYAIKLTGKISVLDPEDGTVLPPVSMLLGSYATARDAELVLDRVKQGRSRIAKEVVEV